jgi:hypothetical protein
MSGVLCCERGRWQREGRREGQGYLACLVAMERCCMLCRLDLLFLLTSIVDRERVVIVQMCVILLYNNIIEMIVYYIYL